uniref:Uncharacterized protein n=1 Tax=Cacopsylla melanoneura TaxID=428564 RepID=A0A8D8UC99_9HEMI
MSMLKWFIEYVNVNVWPIFLESPCISKRQGLKLIILGPNFLNHPLKILNKYPSNVVLKSIPQNIPTLIGFISLHGVRLSSHAVDFLFRNFVFVLFVLPSGI